VLLQPTTKTEEYYARYAKAIDMMSPPLQQKILKTLLEKHIPSLTASSVLDYGCGVGLNISTLRSLNVKSITGVDISQKAVDLAKKKHGKVAHISFQNVSDKQTQFQKNQYDIIICTEVLEHVSDPYEIVNLFSKLLKNNGYIFISTPNYLNPTGIIKLFYDMFSSTHDWNPWGAHKGGFERFTTSIFIRSLFKKFDLVSDTGGDIVLSWGYPFRHILSNYHEKLFWPQPLAQLSKLFLMNYYALYQKK